MIINSPPYKDIYPKLQKERIILELKPELKGNRYLLNCPSCQQREAYLYKNGIQIRCNRENKCGYKKSLSDYVQERDNLDNKETYQFFLKAIGEYVDLNRELTEEEIRSIHEEREKEKKQLALEDAFDLLNQKAQERLLKDDEYANKAREYLNNRGFENNEIKDLGLGLFVDKDTMLKSFQDEEAQKLLAEPLSVYRDNIARISIPIIGTDHRIKGFTARDISNTSPLKYLRTKHYQRDEFFNAQTCIGAKDIWVVEGELDALSGKIRGAEHIIAMGTSTIGAESIALKNLLQTADAQARFILVSDNDPAGGKGLHTLAVVLGQTHEIFVAGLPESLNNNTVKDLNDFIKNDQSKQTLLEHPDLPIYHWYNWVIKEIQSEIPEGELNDIKSSDLKKKLYDKYSQLQDPHKQELFIEHIARKLSFSRDLIAKEFQSFSDREQTQKRQQKIDALKIKIKTTQDEKDLSKATKELQGLLDSKENEEETAESFWSRGDLLLKQFLNTPEGLCTGYKEIDKTLGIPVNAITFIGGRPGGGKTSFMMNLLVNMLKLYEKHTFLFLSYEEMPHMIWRKLINIQGNKIIHEDKADKNLACLSCYLRDGQDMKGEVVREVVDARQHIDKALENKRLSILGKTITTTKIENIIQTIQDETDGKLVVFIDYLQKIPGDKKAGTRQLELQGVSNNLLEMAKKYTVPIIAGCQLRRPEKTTNKDTDIGTLSIDMARECGDIEQDAELFLGVQNNTKNKQFSVRILKNRNGLSGLPFKLQYNPPTFKVFDNDEESKASQNTMSEESSWKQ